jgi:pimeloyl-ACP methyl ester carboxylesterase
MTLSLSAIASPQIWLWRGYPITYQSCGQSGPAVVCVHGFGASWGHWRKNLPVLGEVSQCYALDLIGFGGSAKPAPGKEISYTFETWAEQIAAFCREVVGGPAFLVGNSIGCIAIMQAAVSYPDIVLGVATLNCSLRLLHERKRSELPWYRRQGADFMQTILKNPFIGRFFYQQIAKPQVVKKILLQAYHHPEAVTDELVQMLLQPAYEPGAAAVFLAFTGYSQGPLPEDLYPQLPCRALILWGTEDPWEPLALGRELAKFPTVEAFIPLEGLGHCPQDEGPEIVNPILKEWLTRREVGGRS